MRDRIFTFVILFVSLFTTSALRALTGTIYAGHYRVYTSTVQLWAVNTNGAGATQLASTTSDTSGNFTIASTAYTCPASTTQVYLTANGGNPGLSGNNPKLALIAALGNCSSAGSLSVIVNEVTTVATVWSLQQFMGVTNGTAFAENIGVDGSPLAAIGMVNAFSTVPNLVTLSSGTAVSSVTNATIENTKIDTIANILYTCTRSDGTTPCTTLFADATPSGGTTAADTLQAALYLAKNPANNVATLYALQPASPPFTPDLAAAPFDYTLAISYGSSGLNIPYLDAVDGNGNIWITDAGGSPNNALIELNPAGQPVTGSPFLTTSGLLSGPQTVMLDTIGNVWIVNHGSGANNLVDYTPSTNTYSTLTAASGCLPETAALDTSNNAFFACSGITNLYEFENTGTASVPAYAGTALAEGAIGSTADGMAIDPDGNVWVGNEGSNSVTEFTYNHYGTAANTFTVGTNPFGVAVDHGGNVWIANSGSNTVNKLVNGGSGTYTNNSYSGGGLRSPRYVAIDGRGNVWVANSSNTTVSGSVYISMSEFSNSGSALSPAYGTGIPGGFAHVTTAGTPQPRGIAIDPSGNVWMTECGSTSSCTTASYMMELVGAAAPVVTPIATGIAENELGCCGVTPPAPGAAAPGSSNGSLSLQAYSYEPDQNNGAVAFEVTRSSGSSTATVHYATANGSAIAGTDYTAASGTLTWNGSDVTPKTITVPLKTTANYAGAKTFSVNLSAPTGGAVLYPEASTFVSVSDDYTPPLTHFPGLGGWKLGLPIDAYGGQGGPPTSTCTHAGSQFEAQDISQTMMGNGFSDAYFYLNSANEMVFTAPLNGATTSPGCTGSNHTRSELREMYTGTGHDSNNDWTSTTPSTGHTLTATVRMTVEPPTSATDEVTIGQIHGQNEAFILLTYQTHTNNISVNEYTATDDSTHTLTPILTGVSPTDTFSYSIKYVGNTVTIDVTDVTTTAHNTVNLDATAWAGQAVYFKLGAYAGANNYGNGVNDETQVVVSSYTVTP